MILRAIRPSILFVVLGLAACAPSPTVPAQPTSPPAPQDPPTVAVAQSAQNAARQPASGAVASVNGVEISAQDYEALLAQRTAAGGDAAALETFVLGLLINQELIRQAAAEMDIQVTEAEIEAEIEGLKQIVEGDEAAFQGWLTENNYTSEANFRDELRAQLLNAKVRDAIVGDIATETTRQVHARHILVQTEAEANQIRDQLMSGSSFVDLAAVHSQDVTTRTEGGDLGWFTSEELLEPRIAEVAFAQNSGDISEPVATRLGYHIVETLGFDDLPLQPEKQAQTAQAVFQDWLNTQNDSAMIEIYR